VTGRFAAVRTAAGPSGLVFVALCVVAQFVTLLDVLGYEYSFLVGALVSVIGIPRVIARYGDAPIPGLVRSGARDLAALVAIAGLISLVNMVRVRNCEPGVGVAYLAVFGLGAIPVALGTAGVCTRIARGRWRQGIFAGLLILSVSTTLHWLATQPPIVAYDTFLGYYAGSIFDESLVGFGTHIVYRVWGLAFAVGCLGLLYGREQGDRRWVLVGIAGWSVIGGLAAFRGDLGLARSRAWTIDALGGHLQTEHFDIYFDAGRVDPRRAALMAYDHEARYDEFVAFFDHEPTGRLGSFVYADREQRGDYMGGRRTLVAKIWLGEMHVTWDGVGDNLLAHEMAHLFLREDGTGPLSLSTYPGGIVPIMALVEGAAEAAEWGSHDLDVHAWSAAMYEMGFAEDLDELLGPAGFWGQYPGRAYTLVGSFSRWLIDTRGPALYRQAYAHGDFAGVYGAPLAELVADWRSFLDAYPVADGALEVAEARYDRPSLFGRVCARSVSTRLERGQRFIRSGQLEAAEDCLDEALADDPDNVHARLRVARAWLDASELERAHAAATAVADREGAGVVLQAQAAELVADIAWWSGDTDAALAAYRTLRDAAVVDSDLRRLDAKIGALAHRSTHPRTAAAVRLALVERPWSPDGLLVAELLTADAAEGSPLARYLAALRAVGTRGVAVESLLDDATIAALTAPQQRNAARVRALAGVLSGDTDRAALGCERMRRLVDDAPPGSALRAEAQMWHGRCERGSLPRLDDVVAPVE